MMKRLGLLLAFALAACAPVPAPSEAPAPTLLLVGNKGENSLSFVDLATGRELGRSPTGPMPHEIALSPDGRTAAIVSYGARSIDLFDLATRRRVRTIDLSPNEGPHGIAWLADGRLVATTERSRSLAIVDTARGDAVSAIPTGQPGSHMVAVSPDLARAFVSNIPAGTVTVIDLAAARKIRDLAVGGNPEGIALTPDGRELWVADLAGARVQVFDTVTFARIAEHPTGARPIRVAISPDGRWAVTSNFGEGTLTLIDRSRGGAPLTLPVSGRAQAEQVTILFSADGRRLYVAETADDRVAEVEMPSGRVLRRIGVGRQGDGLALAPAPR